MQDLMGSDQSAFNALMNCGRNKKRCELGSKCSTYLLALKGGEEVTERVLIHLQRFDHTNPDDELVFDQTCENMEENNSCEIYEEFENDSSFDPKISFKD